MSSLQVIKKKNWGREGGGLGGGEEFGDVMLKLGGTVGPLKKKEGEASGSGEKIREEFPIKERESFFVETLPFPCWKALAALLWGDASGATSFADAKGAGGLQQGV